MFEKGKVATELAGEGGAHRTGRLLATNLPLLHLPLPEGAFVHHHRRQRIGRRLGCSRLLQSSFFSSWRGERVGPHRRDGRLNVPWCSEPAASDDEDAARHSQHWSAFCRLPTLISLRPPCLHLNARCAASGIPDRGGFCRRWDSGRLVGGGRSRRCAGGSLGGDLAADRGLAVAAPGLGGGDLCAAGQGDEGEEEDGMRATKLWISCKLSCKPRIGHPKPALHRSGATDQVLGLPCRAPDIARPVLDQAGPETCNLNPSHRATPPPTHPSAPRALAGEHPPPGDAPPLCRRRPGNCTGWGNRGWEAQHAGSTGLWTCWGGTLASTTAQSRPCGAGVALAGSESET